MIGKNVKGAVIALLWIIGAAFVSLLVWALAQGCVPTGPLEDAVREGLHKGISDGLANAGGIASERLADVLPQVVETAVRTAMEHAPKPRELPVGVEAGIAFIAAVGFRAVDHWRKRRRVAMVALWDADGGREAGRNPPEPVGRRPEPTPAPPLPQVQGATNQEAGK